MHSPPTVAGLASSGGPASRQTRSHALPRPRPWSIHSGPPPFQAPPSECPVSLHLERCPAHALDACGPAPRQAPPTASGPAFSIRLRPFTSGSSRPGGPASSTRTAHNHPANPLRCRFAPPPPLGTSSLEHSPRITSGAALERGSLPPAAERRWWRRRRPGRGPDGRTDGRTGGRPGAMECGPGAGGRGRR